MKSLLSLLAAFVIILVFLLDLGLIKKRNHSMLLKEAIAWSLVWVGLAFAFNIVVFFALGAEPALEFLSGYLVEKSLSIDNLFVFLVIFAYFKVPRDYQHKVLFWGILGAILFRAVLIYAGIQIIQEYHWVLYVLGLFLVITGLKTLHKKDGEHINMANNRVLRILRRFLPLTDDYHQGQFFVRIKSKIVLTPLFLVLAIIETTDVLFAMDSIPAILGITTDPFILLTSNIFAILGLRALFFVLDGLMKTFRFLSTGVAVILIFVGGKMLVAGFYEVTELVTLLVIAMTMALAVAASVLLPMKTPTGEREH